MKFKTLLKKALAKAIFKIVNTKEYDELESMETSKKYIIANFKGVGTNYRISKPFIIKNPQYISIGDNFSSLYNLRLEAWDNYEGANFKPEIIIGNHVIFNTDCHLGCINKIVIGNNVMIASKVYISDHSHGEITRDALKITPSKRPLFSKGPIIIGDNVWIGEGACVLPGVTIGRNCIIGANSVVTKSFPENSVIAGVPAMLLRTI